MCTFTCNVDAALLILHFSEKFMQLSNLILQFPAIAPAIGVARRLNATSIEMSWDPLSVMESQGVVTAYLCQVQESGKGYPQECG